MGNSQERVLGVVMILCQHLQIHASVVMLLQMETFAFKSRESLVQLTRLGNVTMCTILTSTCRRCGDIVCRMTCPMSERRYVLYSLCLLGMQWNCEMCT